MRLKNILITGGAGFIGSNLALQLIKKGYQVRVLDNLSPQVHGNNPRETSPLYQSILNEVDFIEGSVTSKKDWRKALKGQDAVIHLAAETGTGQSMYQIHKYSYVNIQGTSNLLDLLTNVSHTIRKVIVASSRAVYGEGKYKCSIHGVVYPKTRREKDLLNRDFECKCPICNNDVTPLPTSEDSLIHPTSLYGITKQTQEQMSLLIGKTIGVPVIAFRFQNVYGPGQSLSNPYTGILSIFSTQIKNHNNINIFEDGKESRDFVYITDAVNAICLGLEDKNIQCNVFNVGTQKPMDVFSIAMLLRQYYNSSVDVLITRNYRLGDIRHNIADLHRINDQLGYVPNVSFPKGIRWFCDWVNSQDIGMDLYLRSILELRGRNLLK